MIRRIALLGTALCVLAACERSTARDHIRVVGSSTVFPFTTAVAEALVNADPEHFRAPVIESTGTGAGAKLFCAGIGAAHPDMLNASRRLKRSEYADCVAHGAGEVLEVQVGVDGVALAESNNGPRMALTSRDVWRALAAAPDGRPNAARLWRDVNPALPAVPIQVLGPPSTSGTRDALVELILTPACEAAVPDAAALKARDKDAYEDRCTRIRDDGAYVDKGENDNLIVQNLAANPSAIGVFGYSYLEENAARLHGIALNGVAPSYATIANGQYPGARPLFLYVKKAHLRAVPGMTRFLQQYAAMWAPDGPLVRRGMIAAAPAVRAASMQTIARGRTLDPQALH